MRDVMQHPMSALNARRGNITRLLSNVEGAVADLGIGEEGADGAHDEVDRAKTLHERGEAAVIAVLFADSRRQIENAIRRLEAGAYGVCEECGETIPPERLKIWPEATRCVICQQREDMRAHARQ